MSKPRYPQHTKLSPEEYERLYPVAFALRAAGYVPIPRYWIKGEDMAKLKQFTDAYRDEINAIRREVHTRLGITSHFQEDFGPLPIGIAADVTDEPRFDPKVDRDAAWKAWEAANGKK